MVEILMTKISHNYFEKISMKVIEISIIIFAKLPICKEKGIISIEIYIHLSIFMIIGIIIGFTIKINRINLE